MRKMVGCDKRVYPRNFLPHIIASLLPVIVIALVSFLIKTGVLSAAAIGMKKLWEWIRKK